MLQVPLKKKKKNSMLASHVGQVTIDDILQVIPVIIKVVSDTDTISGPAAKHSR